MKLIIKVIFILLNTLFAFYLSIDKNNLKSNNQLNINGIFDWIFLELIILLVMI